MSSIINNLYGTSLITTSINIAKEYDITLLSTENKTLINDINYRIISDNNGINSIIEFDTVPFIDFNNYDNERRMFFNIDKYGSLWRVYKYGDYVIELDAIFTNQWNNNSLTYFSMENLFKNVTDYINDFENKKEYLVDLNIKQYQPIYISVRNEELKDITDYAFNINPTLNFINPENNKQFYIKGNKIYSNIDFLTYNIDDINISYYRTIDSVNVTCVLDANSSNYSNYTPVVDYYMLKLTGQTI